MSGQLPSASGASLVSQPSWVEPLPPDRQDNLYTAVGGDHGAHGRFDATAIASSAQAWWAMHRGLATTVAGVAITIAIALAAWWLA